MINSPKYSRHHIVAKERGGTNQRHNIVELKHNVHQAIHTVFGTEPINEKIRDLLSLELSALRNDVVTELLEVLDRRGDDLHERYKPECFK